jgi:ABC-type multidrug transport system permease subunit
VGRFSLIATVRHLYRTNPSFTVYWTWATLLTACATVYLALVASWIALLTLALCVFAVGVLAGGAMYGKGTPVNAFRALAALMRWRDQR